MTVPLVASITIEKSVTTPPPYAVGQQVSYTYAVTNTGGSDLLGVVITDDRVPLASISCPVALARARAIDGVHRYARDPVGTDQRRRLPREHGVGDVRHTDRAGR